MSDFTTAPAAQSENSLGLRVVATLVDILVFIPVSFVFVLLFGDTESGDGSFQANLGGLGTGLLSLTYLAYTIVMEGLKGQTIGKMAAGIYVMTEDGRQPDWGTVVIRNLFRIIDSLPFLYLVGFITAAVTSKHQRLGDLVAKTVVGKRI